MNNNLHSLFSQVYAINKKYENILNVTGEEFNIFRILKLHAAENRTHSAFLAELLNPKGSHGQKDVFLRLFLKQLENLEIKTSFLPEKAKVVTERHIGFLNADKSSGGRLDICLTDLKNQEIYIENKIYAEDQENQLIRYNNHNPDALLLYLCFDHKDVSQFSAKSLIKGQHYHIITYRHDIISWLNNCKKEATSHPILRESITQYINLIKYLTGQTINKEMDNEIIDEIIKDKNSLKAAFDVYNTLDVACENLKLKFVEMMKDIALELGLVFEEDINWYKNYKGFLFYKDDWQFANITFQFQSYDKKLVYGIGRDEECKNLDDELTKKTFEKLSIIGGDYNTWWPFVKNVEEPYDNWDRVEPWQAIQDGSIKEFIKLKVQEILALLGDASV